MGNSMTYKQNTIKKMYIYTIINIVLFCISLLYVLAAGIYMFAMYKQISSFILILLPACMVFLMNNIHKSIIKRFRSLDAKTKRYNRNIEKINKELIKEIQERVKIERELQNQVEFLNNLANTIPSPIFVKDAKGIYINCNKAFSDFVNLSKNEIINHSEFELFDRENAQKFISMDQEVLLNKNIQSYEYNFKNKNGEEHYVICTKSAYKTGYAEEYGIVGIISDISKQKSIEIKFAQSEERYRTFLELLPFAVMVQKCGIINFVNKACCELLGSKDANTFIGMDALEVVHPSIKSEVGERIRNAPLWSKNPYLVDEKWVTLDNKVVEVEVVVTNFPYSNETNSLVVARDVTDRKQNAELRKKVEENTKLLSEATEYDKIKTEFFANISHELRTPLNLILGSLQLLDLYTKDGTITNADLKVINKMNIIKQNCFRLLRLINNIIDVTKIDSGFFDIAYHECDIVMLTKDIVLSVTEYVQNKGINLSFESAVEEKIILCDSEKIERILLNLLSNAVKFTNSGGSIRVSICSNNENIKLSVKDTGIGIPKDNQKAIFERFIQVDKSLSRTREGSGIGLSIVKSLVEMHGGNIYVESECNKGSEFIVEIPIKHSNNKSKVFKNNEYKKFFDAENVYIEFSDIYSIK